VADLDRCSERLNPNMQTPVYIISSPTASLNSRPQGMGQWFGNLILEMGSNKSLTTIKFSVRLNIADQLLAPTLSERREDE